MYKKGLLDRKICFVLLLVALLCWIPAVQAGRPNWQRQQVDWRLTDGSRIKAVNYHADKQPILLNQHRRNRPKIRRKAITPTTEAALAKSAAGNIFAAVIDSPPLDGFVPWIVVSVTDAGLGYWEFDAVPSESVYGNYLTGSPQTDYAVGIFDTGASTSLISDDDAFKTGMYDQGFVTSLEVELIGATGTATAYTTNPLGTFIAGLDVLEPNGLLLNDAEMIGEYNVSVLAGDPVESPNLPTAIGMPQAIYTGAAFSNNNLFSTTIDGNDFNSPYITFYSFDDYSVPTYSNHIDLELRPTGAAAVQYLPCDLLAGCGSEPDGTPLIPSIIWTGLFSGQCLFFLPLVSLADGGYSFNLLDGFMLDTGAQITVISRTIASGLHLSTSNPDFTVEIQDVTGQITVEPGFFLDSLQIPADGEWLEYTNVPVVAINVASPEGGYLNGVIGMNLFVDLNFVINGGGLESVPTLEFESACHIAGDIVPPYGDCIVDYYDLAEFTDHWLEDSNSPDWSPQCDLAPSESPDDLVNFLDFAALAQNWLQGL
jgi:hypothetical protein